MATRDDGVVDGVTWRVERSAAVLAAATGSADPTDLLNANEHARWSRLRAPQDRDDFLAARVLVRTLLGADLPLTQRCDRCGGPHGRPSVVDRPEIRLSWAHASGVVAAVVSDRPVGIDLEPAEALVPVLDGRVRSVRDWVRLEALVKTGAIELDGALALAEPRLPGVELTDWVDGVTGSVVALAVVQPLVPGNRQRPR